MVELILRGSVGTSTTINQVTGDQAGELPAELYTQSWTSPGLATFHIASKDQMTTVYAATARFQTVLTHLIQLPQPSPQGEKELAVVKREMKRSHKKSQEFVFSSQNYHVNILLRKLVVKCQMHGYLGNEDKKVKAAIAYVDQFLSIPLPHQVRSLFLAEEVQTVILTALIDGQAWVSLKALLYCYLAAERVIPAMTEGLVDFVNEYRKKRGV